MDGRVLLRAAFDKFQRFGCVDGRQRVRAGHDSGDPASGGGLPRRTKRFLMPFTRFGHFHPDIDNTRGEALTRAINDLCISDLWCGFINFGSCAICHPQSASFIRQSHRINQACIYEKCLCHLRPLPQRMGVLTSHADIRRSRSSGQQEGTSLKGRWSPPCHQCGHLIWLVLLVGH